MVAELEQEKGKEKWRNEVEIRGKLKKMTEQGPHTAHRRRSPETGPPSPESCAVVSPQPATDRTRFSLIYREEEMKNGNEEAFWVKDDEWVCVGVEKMKKNEGRRSGRRVFVQREKESANFKEWRREGRVWLGAIRKVCDNLQPKLAIMYSFNLKPLKPASNFFKLQNIFNFTTPSYFKLFIS